MLSIVLPTYNERDNIATLLSEIAGILGQAGVAWEAIVVDDDSPDGTAEAARALARDHPITVLVRRGRRGLATAVVEGCAMSRGSLLAVMDADHSHPPGALIPMLGAISEGANLVVGSRRAPGGGSEEWPLKRRLISRGAALLAAGLTQVRDPTSGFLMFRREVLEGVSLSPSGFKIGLEILVKGRHGGKVAEVPIRFVDRVRGESKLGGRVVVQYVAHLGRLYAHKWVTHGRVERSRLQGPGGH